MAQVGIREYDGKKMYFESIGQKYNGILVKSLDDLDILQENKKYVIKPDMLFGKRGKYGLVGVNLNKTELKNWFLENFNKTIKVKGVEGNLDTFIVEDFIPHKEEYYISFEATRENDIINFSDFGGIDVEENWAKVKSININILGDLKDEDLNIFGIQNKQIISTIKNLWKYYKNYGFTYLEVNPFCFDDLKKELVLLDMVAKIDDQEAYKQKNNWKDLEIPNSFGFTQNQKEKYIKELDSQTGASLKFKVLNENGSIWTLLAGGGGSLVITDSLGNLGFADELGNYGELSGNPTREFTKKYSEVLIEQMLESKTKKQKYLIIAGAIANFTNIKNTFTGIIDIFKEKKDDILKQNIKILVRRGGIQEKEGLEYFLQESKKLGFEVILHDSSFYMTDILKYIN